MTHFNQSANTWDTPEKVKLNEHYAQKIKSLIKNKHPKKILEVGCGTGLLGSQFVEESNVLIGIDTSTGMLEVFNQKFSGNKNVKSQLLNLEVEDLDESNFDLIISAMAFHHLKDPGSMLIKLKQRLSANGSVAVIDLDLEDGSFHPDPAKMGVFHSGFSKETTDSWGKAAGFSEVHREIVHTIAKNDKEYPIFLTVFSH